MSLSQHDKAHEYKPGSIRRIKLRNFLTYGHVEFHPGPRLNMVVGPNGTGKSTILCAICLGLGGEPRLLGRADDARLFIMHEQDLAEIEIEVAPFANEESHTFRRTIDRNKGTDAGRGKGSSTWYVNGTKTTAKQVREIVTTKYHISIDNLCTFLPQDRVGNFSGFTAQDLLIETEKSLSGSKHLYDVHMRLIQAEKDLSKGGNETERLAERLQALEVENQRLEREKERMEEREKALYDLQLLEKKIAWMQFDSLRDECMVLKDAKSAAKAAYKEVAAQLQPLEQTHAVLASNRQLAEAKVRTVDGEVKLADRELNKHHEKAETHFYALDDTLAELNQVDTDMRRAQRQVEVQKEKVQMLETQMADHPSKADVEQAVEEAKQNYQASKPEIIKTRNELGRTKGTVHEIREQHRQAMDRLKKIQDDRAIRRERIFHREPKLGQVYQWIEENRKEFRRPVWGPIMCEVTTKTKNAAAFLENHVPYNLLKTFVVECREDEQFIYREVREKRNLPVNTILIRNGKLTDRPCLYSDEKMNTLKQQHGVVGYLDDAFMAPDPVREALRHNASVHRVLVGTDKTQESIDRHDLINYLTQKEQGNGREACVIFTSHMQQSFRYHVSISRFSGEANENVLEVSQARMLAPGVTDEQKAQMQGRVTQLEEDMEKHRPAIEELEKSLSELEANGQLMAARLGEAKKTLTQLAAAQQKLKTAKKKLKANEVAASTDMGDRKKELVKDMMNRIKNGLSSLETHNQCHVHMMTSTHTMAGVKINQDGLIAAERKALVALNEKKASSEEIGQKYNDTCERFKESKARLQECRTRADQIAPLRDENGNDTPLKAQLEELVVENLEEANVALEDANNKVNSIDANPDAVRQYEARQKEMEEVRQKLEEETDAKDTKLRALDQERQPWEAALENSVSKVNALFGMYMQELGCAGEVKLSKGDDGTGRGRNGSSNNDDDRVGNFEKWGIQIMVRFREGSKLQVLSAQVQSGGERSVSTIMYLMALQEMMVSPFRCVDEINQGLDERNERLVFKRIVANSTRPAKNKSDPTDHSGQYFLITPKLLPNLYDMESEEMTVLFIFNGPYNFKHPQDWNVRRFIDLIRQHKRKASQALEDGDAAAEEDVEHDENSPVGINGEEEQQGDDSRIPLKKRRKSTNAR